MFSNALIKTRVHRTHTKPIEVLQIAVAFEEGLIKRALYRKPKPEKTRIEERILHNMHIHIYGNSYLSMKNISF